MAGSRHSTLRVRDTDRVDACALLDAARDDGQLTADEHADRTAKAMRAKTFGDLDALVGDLQIPANLVDAPVVRTDRRGRSRRLPVALGLVVAAGLAGGLVGCVAEKAGPGPSVPDMTSPSGMATVLAAYRDHFGDTMVDEITFYPGYTMIERPRPGDPTRSERLRYNGTFSTWDDTSRAKDAKAWDLASIDLPRLARICAGAPQTLRGPGASISHIGIERSASGQPPEPVVGIYVNDHGWLQASLTGEPLAIHPS
ncbi:DUF1707 domain-containing protein [Nocardia sp. NPDC004068]|uniref:DUF1707 SHOCT-like domain-containing protein n=1 Tax=Nocardia sp. NPDC004068 TaxID=3364303 RepID=UPI00369871D9